MNGQIFFKKRTSVYTLLNNRVQTPCAIASAPAALPIKISQSPRPKVLRVLLPPYFLRPVDRNRTIDKIGLLVGVEKLIEIRDDRSGTSETASKAAASTSATALYSQTPRNQLSEKILSDAKLNLLIFIFEGKSGYIRSSRKNFVPQLRYTAIYMSF